MTFGVDEARRHRIVRCLDLRLHATIETELGLYLGILGGTEARREARC